MASKKGIIEHRRHRRYPMAGGVIVSTPTRLGEVLNLGLGGLSFRCIDHRETTDQYEAAILFGEDDLLVEEVTLKVIGDYTREIVAGRRQIRVLGARFGELNAEQKQTLRDFIRSHAKPGPAPPAAG